MVSGAEYTVIGTEEVSGDDEELSSGTSNSGEARAYFSRKLRQGEKLKTNEDVCGVISTFAKSQAAESYANNKLAAPELKEPVFECDKNVYANGGVHGAHIFVNVEENSVKKLEKDQCTTGQANFSINPALKENDEIFMWQEFKFAGLNDAGIGECPQRSNDTPKIKALSVELIEPLHVIEPLCADGPSVRLDNLRPGAKVIITHNGVEYESEAGGNGPEDFDIGPLAGGKSVFAFMEICGFKTGDSNTVDVDEQPNNLPDPILQDPLFTCTNKVHVSNIHPGAYGIVHSTYVGPIANVYVYADEANITVPPGLMENDAIYVTQKGCGLTSDNSNEVIVKKADDIKPPRL